ncbi:hypothetical protein GURKE_04780 [Brevundimonas phage vB_BpoS-Gurke]|uniref:Uncharacterized protein n=1 Tax=Brevundimonas phage vB_BpoS-Gurke TaxID=2948599 RepID=A0A9E7N412_9CAUD|nr:hypothetical protein GURKE_04780 [Brevundimonas phage vB_BpoS-Gurke]
MNNDRITVSKTGAVTFDGRDAVKLYGLVSLRAAIKLHRDTGMIPTRGVTITKMLASASTVTGKAYKGKTKHDAAIADLTATIDAAKAAMPVEAA